EAADEGAEEDLADQPRRLLARRGNLLVRRSIGRGGAHRPLARAMRRPPATKARAAPPPSTIHPGTGHAPRRREPSGGRIRRTRGAGSGPSACASGAATETSRKAARVSQRCKAA